MESKKEIEEKKKKQKNTGNNILLMGGYNVRSQKLQENGSVKFNYRGNEVKSPFIDLSTLEKSDDLEKFLKEQLSQNNFAKQDEITIVLDIHGLIVENKHFIFCKNEMKIETDKFINVLDKVLGDLKMHNSKLVLLSCYGEHVLKSLKLNNINKVITVDNSRILGINELVIKNLIVTRDIETSLNKFYRKHMVRNKEKIYKQKSDIKTYEERLDKFFIDLSTNRNDPQWRNDNIHKVKSIILSIVMELEDNFRKYEQKLNKFEKSKIVPKTISLLERIIEIDKKYPQLKLIDNIHQQITGKFQEDLTSKLVLRLKEKLKENGNKVTADKIQTIKDTQKIIDIIYTANKSKENNFYYETQLDLLKQELNVYTNELKICQKQSETSIKESVRSNLLQLLYRDINRFKDQGAALFKFIMMIIKFGAEHQIGVNKMDIKQAYFNNKTLLRKYFDNSLANGSYETIKDIKQAMEVFYSEEQLKADDIYNEVVKKLSKMEDKVSSKLDQQEKAISIKGVDEASIIRDVMIQTIGISKQPQLKELLNKLYEQCNETNMFNMQVFATLQVISKSTSYSLAEGGNIKTYKFNPSKTLQKAIKNAESKLEAANKSLNK